jgi:glycogen debranching enzyme
MFNRDMTHTMLQALQWGDHAADQISQERLSPPDTQFTTTGRRIYVTGDIDGRFRKRSNPYDLYALGQPDPNDPLGEKLQGVWAQPVKGFNRYGYTIDGQGSPWVLEDAQRFTQALSHVEFIFQRGVLRAERRDFAALDLPVLISALTLINTGPQALDLRVHFTVTFDLQDAWFTHLGERRNTGQALAVESGCLVARADAAPDHWAAAAGGASPADEVRLLADGAGELVYRLHLPPGQAQTLVFGLSVESQSGAAAALETLKNGLKQHDGLFSEKMDLYSRLYARGPHLRSPDALLNTGFDLARANLHLLEADSPGMGRYFYAGLEMFPFWFSNDGAYSLVGMMASGLSDTALNHIRLGNRFMDKGRVPHQISPAAHVAFAGNAQETPLWVMSIWDAYRWTGDRAFLEELYSGALQGMLEYVLGAIDPDGDGYPSGPGMVEVEGMGAEKLDGAAYTWSALLALANIAETLEDLPRAQQARDHAERIARRFDADWWDEAGGSYAMSLEDPGNRLHPVPHWAVIVPLEVGLAAPEHAARTFATLRAQYLNQWGLKHTVGTDERVWSLPTATLSRAAFRYAEPGLGLEMLRHVAETLEGGSIGLFHELIPEGACFIQLWSAAVLLRGVIEDLLGIQVNAGGHVLRIAPQIPPEWGQVALEDLAFGAHRVTLRIETSQVTVEHLSGPVPLQVEVLSPGKEISAALLHPGDTRRFE